MFGLFLPLFAAAGDYLEPKLLTGSIYDKPEGRLLFTFRRTATQTGDAVRVLREFRDTNGVLVAQERVSYEHGHLVRFDLDELQIGASGNAVIENVENQQRIDFQYSTSVSAGVPLAIEPGVSPGGTNAGSDTRKPSPNRSKQKHNIETIADEPLTADSLGPFIAAHWDELNRATTVRFRYLVVPRLETIGFKLTRESTGDFKGKKVVRLKMSPSSWIIARALDPLIFTVESDPPHRVLQYWGRTTPKIRSGQSWRDLDALTVFDWPGKTVP